MTQKEKIKNLRLGLRWALQEAKGWRGYYVGCPDPTMLTLFDKRVNECEKIMKETAPKK